MEKKGLQGDALHTHSACSDLLSEHADFAQRTVPTPNTIRIQTLHHSQHASTVTHCARPAGRVLTVSAVIRSAKPSMTHRSDSQISTEKTPDESHLLTSLEFNIWIVFLCPSIYGHETMYITVIYHSKISLICSWFMVALVALAGKFFASKVSCGMACHSEMLLQCLFKKHVKHEIDNNP